MVKEFQIFVGQFVLDNLTFLKIIIGDNKIIEFKLLNSNLSDLSNWSRRAELKLLSWEG